jgi:hypothetical protein
MREERKTFAEALDKVVQHCKDEMEKISRSLEQ